MFYITNSVRVKYASTMAAPDPAHRAPVVDAAQGSEPGAALSREAIVATALDVLRAEGMDAVSMRRVASELGTGPASLYAHVAGKDELLDLLYDEVVGAIPLPVAGPGALAGAGHPAVERLPGRRSRARATSPATASVGCRWAPTRCASSELTMALLRAGGVPDQAVAWAVDVVGMYVTANAVEDAVTADLARAGRDPQEYYDQVHDYFAGLPADRFPVTARWRRSS